MAGACITVRVPASLALLRTISAQTANAATIDFVLPSRAEQGHIPLIFASKQLQCPGSARLAANSQRSEEHTSELQSLMRISYAVFCLKKKNTQSQTK